MKKYQKNRIKAIGVLILILAMILAIGLSNKDKVNNTSENKKTTALTTEAPDSLGAITVEEAFDMFKTPQTEIGIDVSSWQGNINWYSVKESGVTFVMIRVGVQDGFDGERLLDEKFVENYNGARAAGLKVGAYYHSCALTVDDAKLDAEFVSTILKTTNCKNFDFPLAFDWESWEGKSDNLITNETLNECADTFMYILKSHGIDTCLYSSTSFINNGTWNTPEYLWVAQYATFSTCNSEYFLWQCSCEGTVPGISGDVDIDILYTDKIQKNYLFK